ncbi:MAG: hypothetical protein M3N08_08860 [Pseudomonadota bacterium]|nr:hypothetical protein [Pseudomonadota bacterium]
MTSWGDSNAPRPTQNRSKGSFAATIKAQFRPLVKVLTDREPAPASQRRQKEETRRGLMMAARRFMRHILRRQFRKLADALRQPVAPSILDNLYAARPYDPEQERAYAEHVLRAQIDEWTRDEEPTEEHGEAYRYGSAVAFDPHP